MNGGEAYLAAAYGVFLVAVLVYVAIISLKLARLEREVDELAALAPERDEAAEREELAVGP